ncbi:MAG TPA: ABC transporter substrate-binding protein [Candidatus Limnocylindrales bacterium]
MTNSAPRRRSRVASSADARRRLSIWPVLAAFVLVAAACSGNQGGQSAGPGASGPSGTGAGDTAAPSDGGSGGIQPPEGDVKLTVWNPFTGPDGNFFNAIVESFNKEHPNIQVTVETQPGAEYVARLEAAQSANQLPHVIAAGYDALPQLVENGILVPIDDLAQQGGYDASMFPEAIWNAGQWKNQRVGIPIDTHPMVFYYNKKLFTEAGLDPEKPPTDKESFEAAIKAISEKTDADGYQMVASGPGANFLVGIQFAALFYQGGGEWTSQDFSEATFNSDAGVQAATYLAHLVKDLGVPKVESDAEINAFQQGKNGMVMSGIWETTRYNDALKDDLGVAPVPEIFGPGTWGGSHNLAVTSAAADDPNLKQAAYYFIDWFSKNSLQWGAAGQIPARNEVRESDEFKNASGEGLLPLIAQMAPMAESVKFLPTIPGGGDLLFVGQGAGEAATLAINGSDPKQALDAAAQYNTEVLKQNKQRYGF